MTNVSIEHATVRYGRTVALDGCSLNVREGELLAVLGPSGCGKSTLLRAVAGLVPLESGSISFDGDDVTRTRPASREVAMVFQGYALYPHLTVAENIAFPLRARKVPNAERERRVMDAARHLGLEHILERPPHACSGGERQRIALARALVREPRVFLLDEPLSNLDAPLRHAARTRIALLQRELGRTMLHVTHDQAEALSLGDRVAVMREGTVRQIATGAELYDRPADTFIAGFIGSPPMNLLRAERWDGPAGRILGIRPEAVRVEADANGVGVIETHEHLGEHGIVAVMANGEEVRARVAADATLRPGDHVNLAFDPARIRWFDAANGNSVER